MIIANIFTGLIIVAAGVLTLKYNFQVANLFGRSNWFERNLGSGSTYLVLKLASVLLMIFGLLMVVGLHDNLLRVFLSPLSNLFQRP